ncbi:MAG TPA: LysR family transcriptional regulator [Verrucomicrobiae bacterium]|jgi:DNA-binding transcriptional LysR family regulator|nr:LysR family transcriptional regulator [Verrucomicrobiae bacterium]
MNIHHLELFYYVARHGGIMEAVRNIPYGIQQPAISGQVAQLEEHLGVTLFHRRPFALTPEGEKLYQFIVPFFSNLEKITTELQGGEARHIRIGASSIILRDHLPSLLRGLRKKFPTLKISLREGYPAHLENLLAKDEIDLAVTLIEKKAITGIHTRELLELPMVLLVEKSSGLKSAEELWKRDKIDEPLICLPPGELLCKQFQQKLAELGVDWFPSIEASSADLVETYVANGLGIGVSVAIPQKALPENVKALPLPDFPPAVIGAMWRGRTTQLLQVFLNEFQARARQLV